MVDRRQLDDVIFHEDHVHRPDIHYTGWERLDDSMEGPATLANRFGKTHHISYLRKRLEKLRLGLPESVEPYEEWLIKMAEMRVNIDDLQKTGQISEALADRVSL
jgi:hypothetical protein